MAGSMLELFSGDSVNDSITPQDFLRRFLWEMGDKKDKSKSNNPKTTCYWDQTKAAFEIKWPETVVVQKAQTDYELELVETKLSEKDLGKKELVLGQEVWMHIIWADKMQKLAAGAKDGAERWRREQEKQKMVEDWITQLTAVVNRQQQVQASLTAGICQQMTNTSLQGPHLPPAPFNANPNPFRSRGGGQGNLFGGIGITRSPVTEAQKEALREHIKLLPQHPNTPPGCLEHQKQQEAWVTKYGMGMTVAELTPYPLRPGMMPVNSGDAGNAVSTGTIWSIAR
ncbi:hypothetical protein B0H10DRAFT_2214216 [Mycena sp. CBHHK59/15]|nr:hypothetical protein B0H10DRAFT_2214216 [Mycena sp. CBHHK59/15]